MPFKLETYKELFCKVEGDGIFFAKKGSMVADIGNFKYDKRLLGTNRGSVGQQIFGSIIRHVTGENLQVMEAKGSGVVFLADQGTHVVIIDLENNGEWNYLCVESEDLLAFTETCEYGVTAVGVGVISQKGFFTSKLSYNGPGAQVAIKTNGNPLILQSPCRVDPDALVAWTGEPPQVTTDVSWKTFVGQSSGESYMFNFCRPGQTIIVQPYERGSGLRVGVDDGRYKPGYQAGGLGGMFGL